MTSCTLSVAAPAAMVNAVRPLIHSLPPPASGWALQTSAPLARAQARTEPTLAVNSRSLSGANPTWTGPGPEG